MTTRPLAELQAVKDAATAELQDYVTTRDGGADYWAGRSNPTLDRLKAEVAGAVRVLEAHPDYGKPAPAPTEAPQRRRAKK